MAKYAQEEAAATNSDMVERIQQRKREAAERKAREEEEAMARYAEEEAAQKNASEQLAASIAQRKRDLAEKKAREVNYIIHLFCYLIDINTIEILTVLGRRSYG
jgi:hypothetical protein